MANYFDYGHQQAIAALDQRLTGKTQWPTWLLIVVIYGGWLGVVLLVKAHRLPLGAATPVLIVLCAWHMSLQHELLHGHPTRSVRFNRLLGYWPLAVWYPYTLYRDTHLAHHRDENLTLPGLDPETNYVDAARWAAMPRWQRALWHARKTFIGRIVIGPPMSVFAMLADTLAGWLRADPAALKLLPMWAIHGATVALGLAWLNGWCGIAWWYYLLVVTWPALSLAMIRSLYEHRAAPHPDARTCINEAGFFMRALYLNLNYHLVHHDLPGLAWYWLPAAYRMRRDAYAQKCAGFVIRGGYGEMLARHAWRETDGPVHPALYGDMDDNKPQRTPCQADAPAQAGSPCN